MKTVGLTTTFLNQTKDKIEELALQKAKTHFIEYGWEGFQKNRSDFRQEEQLVNFFDYDSCVILPLSAVAVKGNKSAMAIIERIISNSGEYLSTIIEKQKHKIPLRRLQLYLVLSYQNLEEILSRKQRKEWTKLIKKNGKLLLKYVQKFKPGGSTPYNGTMSFGLNHYAIVCEGLWATGKLLGNKRWMAMVSAFTDRVLAFAPEDGYFEEHTNLKHEGGPSLRYTSLTSGAMYHVQSWENKSNTERFKKCDEFQRNMVDKKLNLLCFADERSNEKHLRPFGLSLHSTTQGGRAYLRKVLDENGPLGPRTLDLQKLGRVYFEISEMKAGEGSIGAPFNDGYYQLSLVPLGIKRKSGWTAGISSLISLNRLIAPQNYYALDRQNLLFLSHEKTGVILRGFKSKNDLLWSTFRKGSDAYPQKNGILQNTEHNFKGDVYYSGFTATINWELDQEEAILSVSSNKTCIFQMQLEFGHRQEIKINNNQNVLLDESSIKLENVKSIQADKFSVSCKEPFKLIWPIEPMSPYNKEGKSAIEDFRCLLQLDLKNKTVFKFSVIDHEISGS